MRPPGLANSSGNLCYLNSTLQALASLPSFLQYLNSIQQSPRTPLISSLLSLLLLLSSPNTNHPIQINPFILTLANSSIGRKSLLGSREQQDASEFFLMVIEAIEEELAGLKKSNLVKLDLGFSSLSPLPTSRGPGKQKEERNPLDEWIGQRVKCLCCGYTRNITHFVEQLLTIYLPNASSCTLNELLKDYTKLDPISEYNCKKCSLSSTLARLSAQAVRLATPPPSSSSASTSTTTANPTAAEPLSKSKKNRLREVRKLISIVEEVIGAGDYERALPEEVRVEKVLGPAGKELKFARTPEIFSIHLSRSTEFVRGRGARKNSCKVFFGEFLDLGGFGSDYGRSDVPFLNYSAGNVATTREKEGGKDWYRLSSVVVHYGSHSFGHYITYRRTVGGIESIEEVKPTIGELLAQKKNLTTPASSSSSSSSSDPDSSSSSSSSSDSFTSVPYKKISTPLFPAPVALPPNYSTVEGLSSEWYKISDETVEKCSLEEVLGCNPFLIFYEKIKAVTGSDSSLTKSIELSAKVVERWELG